MPRRPQTNPWWFVDFPQKCAIVQASILTFETFRRWDDRRKIGQKTSCFIFLPPSFCLLLFADQPFRCIVGSGGTGCGPLGCRAVTFKNCAGRDVLGGTPNTAGETPRAPRHHRRIPSWPMDCAYVSVFRRATSHCVFLPIKGIEEERVCASLNFMGQWDCERTSSLTYYSRAEGLAAGGNNSGDKVGLTAFVTGFAEVVDTLAR
jgi:hypothetical protein